MLFQNVIGQTSAKNHLRKLVDGDRLPHALLLMGMPGSGDLPLAIAFAQYVLCEKRADSDACGKCSNCTKAAKLVHPDLHFSFPTVGANVTSDTHLPAWRKAMAENPYLDANQWLQRIGAENKQGNINKEECVSIMRKLSLKTFEGRCKILVMWLPEYLQKEGNRLLKLIEEPPDETLFVLVAQNQELILPTLISRCQVVKVNRLSDEEIEQALLISDFGLRISDLTPKSEIRNPQSEIEKARSIAQLADGNFNEALQIAAQPESDHSSLFLDWLRKCYVGNGVEMATWVEKFADLGRENQKQFLHYALHFLREYLVLKTTGNANSESPALAVRLLPKELATAQNLTKVLGFGQVQRIVKLFDDCAYFIERNANQRVLFLDASIQLNKILRY